MRSFLSALFSSALALLLLSSGASAQPPTAADNAKLDADLQRIQKIQQGVSKIGSRDGRCESCPQACELVCTGGDSKCLAELQKTREAQFAACRSRKK